MESEGYFISAIGTDSGKTVLSAILVEALHADYWKPIQCGYPADTDWIKSMVNGDSRFHQEAYRLNKPASPHDAAEAEGIHIQPEAILLPKTKAPLIVEGAGGLMVPINDQYFMIDLIQYLNLPLILVADLYLGSINHTLLSIELLKQRKALVKGLVFNGPSNPASERVILSQSPWPLLLHMDQEDKMDSSIIKKYALRVIKEGRF